MWPRTTWPLSSSTENVALGKTCLILPVTSSAASLTFCGVPDLGTRTRFRLFLLRTAMINSPFYWSWSPGAAGRERRSTGR